jgi:hypothetical protein
MSLLHPVDQSRKTARELPENWDGAPAQQVLKADFIALSK